MNNNSHKDIKGSHLAPNEICEYYYNCKIENCEGKNKNRNNKLSCGLRRAFLMSDGYEVEYGCINNKLK